MTVRVSADGTIELEGICPIEDAEKLQQVFIGNPEAAVDWRSCTAIHAAILQILLVVEPVRHGPPGSEFLRTHIEPLL